MIFVGWAVLVTIYKPETKKAVRPPKIYVDALKKYFEK